VGDGQWESSKARVMPSQGGRRTASPLHLRNRASQPERKRTRNKRG